MTTGQPTDSLAVLRRNYRPVFLAHLMRHDEATLQSAYELGRDAMAADVGMLDLVQIHHEVFSDVVSSSQDASELPDMLSAATTFLVEVLAPFEMACQILRPQLPPSA